MQRDEAGGRGGLVGRVGQHHVGLRRLERQGEQAGEGGGRHGELVVGDGQPALGDVEDAGRGAAVVRRVVQHPVDQAVAAQQRRGEVVAVERQGQLTGQARLVEHQGSTWQLRLHPGVGEVVVEERLDAVVRGAQPVGQPSAQLTLPGEDGQGQPGGVGVLVPCRQGQAELGQSEVDGGVLGVGHESIVVLADPAPPPRSGNGRTPGPARAGPGVFVSVRGGT